jgi:hypothetical protein
MYETGIGYVCRRRIKDKNAFALYYENLKQTDEPGDLITGGMMVLKE